MKMISPIVFEGDFSSYAVYDAFDETDTVDSTDHTRQFALFNLLETIALLVGSSDEKIKTYTIATKAVSTAHTPTALYFAYDPYAFKSAYGTYLVAYDVDEIYIYKDGVEIQVIGEVALGFNANKIVSVHISAGGKYIAVAGQRTSGNDGWVILVGS